MALYPRIVEVSVGYSGEILNFGGLMVSWEVQRTADSRQPSGTVTLYNLTRQHEIQVEHLYTDILLQAGYPDRFGVLVDAQIKDVSRVKSDLDRVTICEIGGKIGTLYSGAARGRMVPVDLAYLGEVTLETVVADIAAQMGLTVEPITRVAEIDETLENWASGLQPAHRILDDLLLPHGLAWYEDTGSVLRFRRGGKPGIAKGGVLTISERTGMIGTPGITEDGLRVRTLIDHRVELDGLVQVQSSFYPSETAGMWKAVAVRHWGDNRDGEAVTELELRQI